MRWIPDASIDRLREAADEPDLAGTRYVLGPELGRGGMGTVWAATDLELDREVALKILPIAEVGEEAVERMRREARILAQLEHPGIVPIHDFGRLADGRVFYAMKLVRGERLDEHLRRRELPLPERLRLFEKICEPVAFAHARGMIHRDLKPSNIMIGPYGEVLVMDWGLARALGTGEADLHGGTPGYMAPEQEGGAPDLDARADVYALGAVLRDLCAGSDIPRPVRAIVARAMATEKAERYPNAAAVGADVARWLDGLAVEAYRETLPERLVRWLRRYRTAVALVAAYLIMRAILFFLIGR